MRMSCQKAFLLVAALTMACDESTAPPQRVSRLYLLESINGQLLPAIENAGQTDTTRVLWGTLTLDAAGNAATAHHWRHVYPPNLAEERTNTWRSDYRITGDSIAFDYFLLPPCPPNAICVANQLGKLTDSTMTLPYSTNPLVPRYLYRLAQSY